MNYVDGLEDTFIKQWDMSRPKKKYDSTKPE
jgi:hypothetical protein